jgi:beta-N-acetylhexosaminidase
MTSLRRHQAAPWVVSWLVACVIGGCGAAPAPTAAPPTPTPSASPVPASDVPDSPMITPGSTIPATPAPPTSAPASPTPPTTPSSCADRTLASLTEPERIGQLFMIGLIKDRLDAVERGGIAEFHFGSMAFTAHTTLGVAGVRSITDAVQRLATPASTGGIRFFVAANQEGGLIQALAGPGFDAIPSALRQGSLAPSVLEQKAARWGRQLRGAGVNVDLAPVADVVPQGTDAQNAPIGQLDREFGHDPATVSSHVAAFIAGMREAHIATTAKHFPGMGRVEGNTDVTAGVVDTVTTRSDPYLAPFTKAVDVGAPFVMVSLATYERIDADHLAVFSRTIVSGMLHDDLGFHGVIISDALGATKAVASIAPGDRALDFIAAGGDMIISNQTPAANEMAQALASRVAVDDSFRARVDNAALHVLRAKDAMGLLPCSG